MPPNLGGIFFKKGLNMKIVMYRVGMRGWQKTCKSIEEALKNKPEFDFIDQRLRDQYADATPENTPADEKETDEWNYSFLSEKEKKSHLEKVAREHGVELDKRKKLENLEEIVQNLIEG